MDREQNILINELTQGKALAKQLRKHLNPSSSPETQKFLIQKILSSYEKALSILNYGDSLKPNLDTIILESPCSFPNSSPRSEASDQDVCKKRKTMPRWTEQVKVCSGTGLEGPLDDGYCWRKYGQKAIHGASHPRGYYRCTHRHAQGCLATKQIQRSDEDPTIFEVTYRGRHTCRHKSHLAMASTSLRKVVSIGQKNHQEHEENPKQAQEVKLNFGTELKVKTEDLDTGDNIFPSFSFSQTSVGHENVEDNIFSETMMDYNFIGSFSPTFISPATSESNYLSTSPCPMNNFGVGQKVQTPESELTDILSTPTSVTNSPFDDFDFSLVKADLDPNFQFESLDCFIT